MFPAVMIDGEHYWDGGYTGNPALFPLFAPDLPGDVLVVNINPLHRDDVPVTARAIQNRINEISFNSSLLRELRAIDFVQRLLAEGAMPEGAMKRVRVHMVSDDALMRQLSVATKLVAIPQVLHQLRAAGRAAAEAFLEAHLGAIGRESSVDLRAMFD
jgi:NTE family protein